MSSSIRLGARTGGRQAPRRESLLSVRYGWVEFGATLVALIYAGTAAYLVGEAGLTTSEVLVRTARMGTIWDGVDITFAGFGFDRPPLLSLFALPLAGIDRLQENGLAAALATSLASAVSVPVASKIARQAGLTTLAAIVFVAAFALNPLFIYAGVFGLPEVIYASLVLLAISEFSRWLDRRDVSSVITSGVALGLAFLLRYNVILLVAVMAWGYWFVAREEERRTHEVEAAQARALAFIVPVVFVMGLWTLVAWFPNGNTFEYLGLAQRLTFMGNDDLAVLDRLDDFRADPLAVGAWIGWWSLLVAPASVLTLVGLLGYAAWARSRIDYVLAGICGAVVLPEAVALLGGWGQAHVPHLFVAIVPGFAIVAYRERQITRGIAPARYEGPRRRSQYLTVGALALSSLASAIAIVLMPGSDPPAETLEESIRARAIPDTHTPGAVEVARFIRENAAPGDVVVDVNRHAEVMLLVGDLSVFQTEASEAGEATLYEPFGTANWVLVRRPVAGQGPGRIENAYGDLFSQGTASLALEFESGDYRLYSVTGPALP